MAAVLQIRPEFVYGVPISVSLRSIHLRSAAFLDLICQTTSHVIPVKTRAPRIIKGTNIPIFNLLCYLYVLQFSAAITGQAGLYDSNRCNKPVCHRGVEKVLRCFYRTRHMLPGTSDAGPGNYRFHTALTFSSGGIPGSVSAHWCSLWTGKIPGPQR